MAPYTASFRASLAGVETPEQTAPEGIKHHL